MKELLWPPLMESFGLKQIEAIKLRMDNQAAIASHVKESRIPQENQAHRRALSSDQIGARSGKP